MGMGMECAALAAFTLPVPENSRQKARLSGKLLTKHPPRVMGSLQLSPGPLHLASPPPVGFCSPRSRCRQKGAGMEQDLSLSQVQYLRFSFIGWVPRPLSKEPSDSVMSARSEAVKLNSSGN